MSLATFETPVRTPPGPTATHEPGGYSSTHTDRRGIQQRQPDAAPGRGLQRDLSGVPLHSGRAGTATTAASPRTPATRKGAQRGGLRQAIGSFFSTLGTRPGGAIGHLLGGTSFTNTELADYQRGLSTRDDIEGDFDSDNKARAVVSRWKTATAGFDISGRQKALLVREMLDGATTNDDEQAILDILTRSENGDLRLILDAVPVGQLLSDIGGANGRRLRAWLGTRFAGGLAAVRSGRIEPVGSLSANAPLHRYDFAHLRQRLEGPYRVSEIIEELDRHPAAEREQAARDMAAAHVTMSAKVNELSDKARAAPSKAARESLETERDRLRAIMLRMDLVMEEAFKDIVHQETLAQLTARATKPTPAQRKAARAALAPPTGGSHTSAPLPFVSRLAPGQPTYEDKLRAASPGMIDSYWAKMAKDRQPADHADPKKMHTLHEMQDLAKVSKDETDAVFGGYYNAAAHKPLKADTPGKRGSLHDLWADTQAFLTDPSTSFADKKAMARALVFYFFQSNTKVVAPLNRQHHASPSFNRANRPLNAEAKAQARVADSLTRTASQVRRLNEIDRGWDASANPATKDVNIQLFRPKGGVEKDQDFMWDMFQTLIHEYLHTLAAPRYRAFANSFGDSPQQNTLIEGMDSFLDEVVWSNISPRVNDPGLRTKVEGPAYAKLPPIAVRPALRRRYASFTEATRLVTIVGFRNVLLAYFKGEIDRIGG